MCGILCVKSKTPIALEQHLGALSLMHSRGPDYQQWNFQNGIFVGQTVLHVTGESDIGAGNLDFAYNGEIYNYQKISRFSNDTRLARDTVAGGRWGDIRRWHGPWAWVYTDFRDIFYASDPQHERHLFVYQDENLLIVTSELKCINHYHPMTTVVQDYETKHWPMLDCLPWWNTQRARPGMLYKNSTAVAMIDSIEDWAGSYDGSYQQAMQDLDQLLESVCQEMMPAEPMVLSYSGGLDSSLLHTYFTDARTVCLDMQGKDPVAARAEADLTIAVDVRTWAKAYNRVMEQTYLPLGSWNWPGFSVLSSNVPERIIFTGSGADELFGGYPYHLRNETSPYSLMLSDSFLADYRVQQGGVDLLGLDLVAGMHGKEVRSPFTHPEIIKFALSLPRHYRVGTSCKMILHDLYRARTGKTITDPKQGFAGHCNDAIDLIRPGYIPYGKHRLEQWKNFVKDDFYQRHCHH